MTENNYGAENIKVLDGLEAVRKRPAMYIGNTAETGLHHLIWEVVDNSIDEALAGYCNTIKVIIHKDNSITVKDNGRGIPVDKHPTEKVSALELVMTTLHAGGKFDKSTYKVSGGLHGVGVSVVNALSLEVSATIKRQGKIFKQNYKYGEKTGELEILGDTKKTGTTISFKPDPEIFTETIIYDYNTVKSRLRELSFLNKNIKIQIKDERSGAEDVFKAEGGIITYVEYLNRKRTSVNNPIIINGEKDNVQVEIAFQYFDGYSERVFSFVNNINTLEGGTHVAGFRASLTKCINKYVNDGNVPKNLINKMSGDDMREGITCVISVRVPEPQFEGQTKTKLGNSEVKSIVSSISTEQLTLFLEQNPAEAKKILNKVVEAARAREAAKRARDLSRKKGSISMLMAGKLAECQEKEPEKREIFIVEGDSAGGSAKQGRDRSVQAILPLRGKIMNVEKARFDKILGSEEIKQLIAALGCGVGKDDFDKEKLRYHKIIIMTDADVDGAHIRTLLLTFFYRQMLPLIEGGFVYIGQPPLYRLGRGKKEKYFVEDEDLNNHLFYKASKTLKIILLGKEQKELIGEKQIKKMKQLFAYKKLITYMSILGYWEDLVSFLLKNKIHSADQFVDKDFVAELKNKILTEKNITTDIRPCSWRPDCYEFDIAVKNSVQIRSTIGPQIPLIGEYRKAIYLFENIKEYLEGNYLIIKTNKSGQEKEIKIENWNELVEQVKKESFKGSHLQRYKGLGEMNPEQLWDTTMNPQNRTLIQVKIGDAEKADDIFTTLMGDKVEPRREFIQNHALEVTDLDI